jgi:putative addiction module component (TIGR02574 family)
MTEIALRLKDQLLSLSEDDRAALVEVLQDSLPDEVEEGYHEAWEAELNRRMEEIESGKAVGRPAREMFDELRKRYS